MTYAIGTAVWFALCLLILAFNRGADARRVGEADPEELSESAQGG